MPQKPGIYVAGYDLHYPKVNLPTWRALLEFIQKNKIQGFIFGGDQFDNQCISHHTKGKPGLRERGAYKKDELGFIRQIYEPIVNLSERQGFIKVWIIGNHDDWERELILENPELEGLVDRPTSLGLVDDDWEVVPLGRAYKLGKLNVIHGEVLTGIGNQAGMYPSRKAVELYSANTLAGHTHSPQSFTKISPVEQVQKWQGWISPILGDTNPTYLENRPTAWLNGFTLIELMEDGTFNVYPIVVVKGKFSYGGKVYKG